MNESIRKLGWLVEFFFFIFMANELMTQKEAKSIKNTVLNLGVDTRTFQRENEISAHVNSHSNSTTVVTTFTPMIGLKGKVCLTHLGAPCKKWFFP